MLPRITKTQPVAEVKQFTVNLAQAASTYDLLTASGSVLIKSVTFYVSVVGATFTSVSVQTNQTNATELLSAVEGAVANIVVQKILKAYTTPIYLATGQKLQYTIVGATGTGTILATVEYMPVSSGASIS